MRVIILTPWVMRYIGSLCSHYDDGDKDDKNGKSAYNGNTHFEGALHIFWYISLPPLHDYDVKSPFSFISFLLNLNEVSINSTPGNFAFTWQVKWFGIIAMKVKGPNTFYWCRFQCRRRSCELRNQRRLNLSHNHDLNGDKRPILYIARIPQGILKYISSSVPLLLFSRRSMVALGQ